MNQLKCTIEEKDKTIASHESRMVNSKQYSRNKNIEIINVEQKPNENLEVIMSKLAKDLEVPLCPGDIDVMHRVPTKRQGAHPKIVVQFTTRTIRERWLEKRRQGVASEKIVDGATDNKTVYIYRHLAEHWRTLLWQARQRGHPLGYHLIWFKDNKIMAKKNVVDRNIVYLYTLQDLVKLV